MCGRYTLSTGHEKLARAFLAEFFDELKQSWKPRYNIAPGSGIVGILEDRDRGGRKAEVLHWGLVPHWAKDPDIGQGLINARAETVHEKPAFRDAFRYRRCLIPASGFYEWDRRSTPRQPYYFYPREGEFMALAGIWEHWLHPSGSEIISAAIITTRANKAVSGIHHRMPVILPEAAWSDWLDTIKVKPEMKLFLEVVPEGGFLGRYAVSRKVNVADTEGPDLIVKRDQAELESNQMDLFPE